MSFDFKQVKNNESIIPKSETIFSLALKTWVNKNYPYVDSSYFVYDMQNKCLTFDINYSKIGLIPYSFWSNLYTFFNTNADLVNENVNKIKCEDEYITCYKIWLCCNNYKEQFKMLCDCILNIKSINFSIYFVCSDSIKLTVKEANELKELIISKYKQYPQVYKIILSETFVNAILTADKSQEFYTLIKSMGVKVSTKKY